MFLRYAKMKVHRLSSFRNSSAGYATFVIHTLKVDMSIRALWIVPIIHQSNANLLQNSIIFTRYCVKTECDHPLLLSRKCLSGRERYPMKIVHICIQCTLIDN